ncbi:MAG TPA: HD domain-containing phosphohydrolase [Gemmatimonadaceae bacterium]|nr:HD domain-containing phosphohydrolase [Gemmatimonadaceae bacterium]
MSDPVTVHPRRQSAAVASAPESSGAKRILIVDDEETIRLAIGKFLRSRGYEVHAADSGMAALELLERHRFVVMLCDIRMPGLSGVEVVPRALALDPDLAVMMLTAVNDAPTATDALSSGAMDYLMKPIELTDLQRAVERALHKRALLIERNRVEQIIREEVASRTEELEHEKQALKNLTVNIAETLVNAMEAKDLYLRGHSQRVAELGASMAEELGLDADTVENVRLAGRLHDIGKIGIRETVLNKPSSLTEEEYEHVKDHVRIGMEILSPLKHLGATLRFVQDHHEHWDGGGYPHGLEGEAISIGGRILAAADAFDALTSKRAYREPLTPQATIKLLADLSGRLLDARVYEALTTVVERRKSLVFIDDMHA